MNRTSFICGTFLQIWIFEKLKWHTTLISCVHIWSPTENFLQVPKTIDICWLLRQAMKTCVIPRGYRSRGSGKTGQSHLARQWKIGKTGSVAAPGFPKVGANFSSKLYENEKNWTKGRARPCAAPKFANRSYGFRVSWATPALYLDPLLASQRLLANCCVIGSVKKLFYVAMVSWNRFNLPAMTKVSFRQHYFER